MRIWDSEPMTYFLWFYILKTNPEYTDSQLLFSFNSRYRNTDILLLSRSLNSRILRPLIVIHHWWTSCQPWDHNWGFRPLLHIIIKQLRHSNLFSSLQIPSSSWLLSNPSSIAVLSIWWPDLPIVWDFWNMLNFLLEMCWKISKMCRNQCLTS